MRRAINTIFKKKINCLHVQIENVRIRLGGVVRISHVGVVGRCMLVGNAANAATHAFVYDVVHFPVRHEFQTHLYIA